jgi:DNA-directed RNA polymerase subunit beta
MKEIQGRAKQTRHAIEIPNLVEQQLNSYRWFLEEGLQELFESFSPIYDFTGNTSISLTDFTLGEPKYSVEECRDRDMTFESPIKAKVLLRQANKEEIESEVYLGDLPLMTDKGTFIINGAERVVVSQLARSPGVYFKDNLDFSGKVLYYATIIPLGSTSRPTTATSSPSASGRPASFRSPRSCAPSPRSSPRSCRWR